MGPVEWIHRRWDASYRKAAASGRFESNYGMVTYRLLPTGLTATGPGSCTWFSWSQGVRSVEENADAIWFQLSQGSLYWIPKSAFATLAAAGAFLTRARELLAEAKVPPLGPLVAYLADHDAPCPGCHYNLRNLTTAVCPECGAKLTLESVTAWDAIRTVAENR